VRDPYRRHDSRTTRDAAKCRHRPSTRLAVLNAVQRADGLWRAADGQHLYQLRHLYGVTVDRAFDQRLLGMGYAMTERADGNGAEIGGVSQQVMEQFSARAQAIDGWLRNWVDQYTAKYGKPPSRRTVDLMGQEIAKDTRNSHGARYLSSTICLSGLDLPS
jgi:hypothetical protein